MRILQNLVTVFAVTLFLFLAVGSSESQQSTELNIEHVEYSIEVSSTRLVSDYDDNEISADLKYKGKVLLVTGTVTKIAKDIAGTMYITLDAEGKIGSVQCLFADIHVNELTRLSKGMSVSVYLSDRPRSCAELAWA